MNRVWDGLLAASAARAKVLLYPTLHPLTRLTQTLDTMLPTTDHLPTEDRAFWMNKLAALYWLKQRGIKVAKRKGMTSLEHNRKLAKVIRREFPEWCNDLDDATIKSTRELIYRFGEMALEKAQKKDASTRKSAGTSVYVIGNREVGVVKVGYATNPEKRISTLQTGCPFDLRVFRIYKDYGEELEAYLHRRYRKQRYRGEWFTISGTVAKDIQGRKGVTLDEFRQGVQP